MILLRIEADLLQNGQILNTALEIGYILRVANITERIEKWNSNNRTAVW